MKSWGKSIPGRGSNENKSRGAKGLAIQGVKWRSGWVGHSVPEGEVTRSERSRS